MNHHNILLNEETKVQASNRHIFTFLGRLYSLILCARVQLQVLIIFIQIYSLKLKIKKDGVSVGIIFTNNLCHQNRNLSKVTS